MKIACFVLLFVCVAIASDERISETVVAQRNGVTQNGVVLNYIIHISGNDRILLTVRCDRRCFRLDANQSYSALFDYRRTKDSDFVWLTGHPYGNLTKPVTMKSTIVNFEVLK